MIDMAPPSMNVLMLATRPRYSSAAMACVIAWPMVMKAAWPLPSERGGESAIHSVVVNDSIGRARGH